MEQQPDQTQQGQLERKLSEMFPDEGLRDAAWSALARYGPESWHREIVRVRLAILKLAGPDLTAIVEQVEVANVDYRDTLAAAEYPAYSLLSPGIDPLDPAALRAMESDRKQYLDWLAS